MTGFTLGLFVGAVFGGLVVAAYRSGDARRIRGMEERHRQELCQCHMKIYFLKEKLKRVENGGRYV